MTAEVQFQGIAERQKKAGAQQVDRFAKVVDSAADELGKEMPNAAEYVHAAASRLRGGAEILNQRSVGELIADFDQFTRRQPIAVFGAAMLAGFALSRFLKSSASEGETTR